MVIQYQVKCNNCTGLYVVQAEPATTLKSSCPYCGHLATVATPIIEAEPSVAESEKPRKEKIESKSVGLGKKVAIVFVIVWFFIIALSSFLYVVFSAMSK
ncbi:hypothetical protein [Prevotella sp. HUN102]|uniref:hypothetical protein n=1 Tax=Prevotella sp. HUN102 TaxID=1392486 RepID=UPI000A609888|nr:hypothetical protein [Prevotella sp. HUN102]